MKEMFMVKEQKIGTYFKKENIFLGTITPSKTATMETVKAKMGGEISEDVLKSFVEIRFLASEEFDVFYKDENGYTRFLHSGPETFAGDNSDGKGTIRNVVSIWDYYSEDEVIESLSADGFMLIALTVAEPIYKYNSDYNKH